MNKVVKEDELIYEKLFNSAKKILGFVICEECQVPITNVFRGNNGKIKCRFLFSHILSKGAYPEFRHNLENFNILCMGCHNKWEFGKKSEMKIYEKNKKIWKNFLE